VRILTNGIGSIDASSASPDHAVAVEPAQAKRIEVLRGASLLRYGSSGSGGIVNVIDGRIPSEFPDGNTDVAVRIGASSVDSAAEAAASIDQRAGNFVFHLDGQTASQGVSPISARLDLLVLRVIVFRQPTEFPAAMVMATKKTKTIMMTKITMSAIERVQAFAGYADYEHTEFEGPGEVGTVFTNEGYEIRVEAIQAARGTWKAAHGVQYRERDFSAIGES